MPPKRIVPDSQNCPVCNVSVRPSARYPDHLCSECSSKAVDVNGRALDFFSTSILGGGFEARFEDDGSVAVDVTENHVCFVDGLRVWADEAYFGGVVLTPSPETLEAKEKKEVDASASEGKTTTENA